jgi:hypothetical protein
MSKFNKNDKITRSSMDARWARIGFKAVVLDGNMYLDALGEVNEIIDDYWELATPKWTIYNNTLPWSDLSDKQKGKLLLAQNNKLKFEDFTSSGPTMPFSKKWVYVVEKPEPTTAELFFTDWHETDVHLVKEFSEYMIGKGWVKK